MREIWFEREINKMIKLVAAAKNEAEVRGIFDAILTPREINDMARRLEIVQMLEKGKTYMEIREKLKVSPNIVSRLSNGIGYGFRRAVATKEKETKDAKLKKRSIRYKNSPTIIEIIKGS